MTFIEETLEGLDISIEYPDCDLTGIVAQAEVSAEQIRPLCRTLFYAGLFLESVSAVDRIADGIMEAVYLFNHYEQNARLKITMKTGRDTPQFPTIGDIYPGAVWHEREAGEFFGIDFEGSKDKRNLLLPVETTFHPLRKDFKRPEQAGKYSNV